MAAKLTVPAVRFWDFYHWASGRIQHLMGRKSEWFWFTGSTGVVDFDMPAGWKPAAVFDAGALQKLGSGDDYTVTGPVNGAYTISFGVAPANGNDIGVEAWPE